MNFNERIWEKCRKVPKGKVTTYKELAKSINSKAYRAVGNAMNKNPNGFLICKNAKKRVPCHRVVDSKGHLHGFAHGLKSKANLLKKEGIKINNNRVQDFAKILYRF